MAVFFVESVLGVAVKDGDPSRDVRVLERGKGVRLVMKDGTVYRDDLASM